MPRFKAQQFPKTPPKEKKLEELYASFCYHYPAYTFARARKVPYVRMISMLKQARREHAQKMVDLIQAIGFATSSKKGAISDGIKHFSDIINNDE